MADLSREGFGGLYQNETFRALFDHAASPVAMEASVLQGRLLTDRTLSEADRHYYQGKLAGIRAVAMLVKAIHDNVASENALAESTTRPEEVRAELRFLPRRLQGTKNAFPGPRRTAYGR